jgi:hypothetical protein
MPSSLAKQFNKERMLYEHSSYCFQKLQDFDAPEALIKAAQTRQDAYTQMIRWTPCCGRCSSGSKDCQELPRTRQLLAEKLETL